MNDILNYVILDNTVKQWLIAIVVIVLAYLFKHSFSKYIAKFVTKLFHKDEYHDYNEHFINHVVKPLETWVFWAVTIFALDKLKYPAALEVNVIRNYTLKGLLTALSSAWVIICFFRLLNGINYFIGYIVRNKAAKDEQRSAQQAVSLIKDIISVLLSVACVFIVLKASFNYDISSLLTSLGLVTAALALAAKETVENMICSFVILFDRPFLVGDVVKVNNISGSVEKIGIRSTRIRTFEKTLVSIPNKNVIGSALENVSYQRSRRFSVTLELAVETSEKQLQDFVEGIRKIIANEKSIIQDNSIMVHVLEVATQSDKVLVEYFMSVKHSFKKYRQTNEKVNLEIVELAKNLAIDFTNSSSSTVTIRSSDDSVAAENNSNHQEQNPLEE